MASRDTAVRMNFFRYTPLAKHEPSGAHTEFRILTILPGAGEKVHCRIKHYLLPDGPDEPATHQYEALSWTWGDADKLDSIIIEDEIEGNREFSVRGNLKRALQHLRYDIKPRDLWVDFVCINQADTEERAAQVKLMFFIYGKAFNVCVWLGMPEKDSDVAIKFVKEQINDLSVWDMITEAPSKEKWASLAALMDRAWFSRRWVVQELALAVKATVHCGADEMDWTEFETAVSLFDRDAQRLSAFYRDSKKHGYHHDFFGDVGQMGATRLVHLKSNLFRLDENGQISEYRHSLVELVSILWSFEAQDPHDVIYAILSIAKDTYNKVNVAPHKQVANTPMVELPELELPSTTTGRSTGPAIGRTSTPSLEGQALKRAEKALGAFKHMVRHRTIFNVDYDQEYFLLCKQFLKFAIPRTEYHNLDILLRPWSPAYDGNGLPIKLPSWIPTVAGAAFKRQEASHASAGFQMLRQNSDALVAQISHGPRSSPYNASQSRTATPDQWEMSDVEDDFSLRVTGFVIDRIGDLQNASQYGNIPEDWLILGRWDKGNDQRRMKSNDKFDNDVLWRTIVGDRGPEGKNTMPYYKRAFQEAIKSSVTGIFTERLKARGHPVLTEFLNRVESVVTNRKLFKSEHMKLLGLAPNRAKDGDYICIIFGMSVPVILRPEKQKRQRFYRLIGECYLHTLMDGRAIAVQETRQKQSKADLEQARKDLQALEDDALKNTNLTTLANEETEERAENFVDATDGTEKSMEDIAVHRANSYEDEIDEIEELQEKIKRLEEETRLLKTQKFELR